MIPTIDLVTVHLVRSAEGARQRNSNPSIFHGAQRMLCGIWVNAASDSAVSTHSCRVSGTISAPPMARCDVRQTVADPEIIAQLPKAGEEHSFCRESNHRAAPCQPTIDLDQSRSIGC